MLKHFNLYVDGFGFAGKIKEIVPPVIEVKTEEMRMGGMDAPMLADMGLNALTCSFTMSELNAVQIAQMGQLLNDFTGVTMRGSLDNESPIGIPIEIACRGRFIKWDPGTWASGEVNEVKYDVGLTYFRYVQALIPLMEIDVMGMRRVVGGIDQLLVHRLNTGV